MPLDSETPSPPDDLGFDPAALRAKYRAERDKRLRPDGNEQYRRGRGRVRPLSSTTLMSHRGSPASR